MDGIKENLINYPKKNKKKENKDYNELKIINQMGFDGYFLIVWDFINWAKTMEYL